MQPGVLLVFLFFFFLGCFCKVKFIHEHKLEAILLTCASKPARRGRDVALRQTQSSRLSLPALSCHMLPTLCL